jgi:hypothetical protein
MYSKRVRKLYFNRDPISEDCQGKQFQFLSRETNSGLKQATPKDASLNKESFRMDPRFASPGKMKRGDPLK